MLAHYRILERLGAGGMGVVYKALDTHLNRTVAIKVLPPQTVADPARRQRFVNEAHAASALDHPHIVTIYDISEADGQHFIVMQYIAGKTLRALLGRGALALSDALRYAGQIADALARAHTRGIVHRDLKPENVMVTQEDQIKILDFGLAKLTEAAEPDETVTSGPAVGLTEEGSVMGTAAYMSPEQAQGKKLDHRTDIFSFGSLLYEMASGRQAFRGENRLAVLSAIVRDEPERLKGVPLELDKLVSRALRKDPERRWQSMADVRVALTEIKEESESGSAVAEALPAPRRRSGPWILAVAALVLLVAGGGIWLRFGRSRPEAPAPAPKVVPLTTFPGLEGDPALSPNGEQVAFSWNGEKQDNFDIYVKLIGPGTPLRLTTDPGDDRSPAWSPDGRYIAFRRAAGNGTAIFLIPALGGPERKLTPAAIGFGTGAEISWSPDGKLLAIPDRSSVQEPLGIFLVSVDSGEKRRLTSGPPGNFGDAFPAFSPDGRTLAFVRGAYFLTTDIHLLSLGTGGAAQGEPRRLTSDDRGIWGLDWTPDGRSIIFASNRTGNQRLWRVPVSGGPPEQLAVGTEAAYYPSVSRHGEDVKGAPPGRLVYQRLVLDANIWRSAGPGSPNAARAAPEKLIASTQGDTEPQFSPDGKRIAFSSARSGHQEIWVCDSQGMNPVQLTSIAGPTVGSPRWYPDGRRLAFDSRKEQGQADIYVISADGGLPRRLTSEPSEDVRPSWSRDGKWIYFGSNRTGAWQVWKAPAEGGAAVQITRNGGREAYESPDGKFLYYAKPGVAGIWQVPVDGGEEIQAFDRGTQGAWIVHAQGIFLLSQSAAPGPAIEFFSFATRRLTQIRTFARETQFYGGSQLTVSADARWILHSQNDQRESDIVLVENFR